MKKLALGLMLVLLFGVAFRAIRSDAPDARLLFDHIWVDHLPRDQTDKFQALWVSGEHPFGNFSTRTVWTGQWEMFHYHVIPREQGVLDFLFGRTTERQRVRYTARPCHEDGFDFCLELSGSSRGVSRYFSKKEWQMKAGDPDAAGELVRAAIEKP